WPRARPVAAPRRVVAVLVGRERAVIPCVVSGREDHAGDLVEQRRGGGRRFAAAAGDVAGAHEHHVLPAGSGRAVGVVAAGGDEADRGDGGEAGRVKPVHHANLV